MGGVLVVVEGPILSWLNDKVKESLLIVAGSLILAAGFFTFQYPSLAYLGAILFGVGNGIMWPSFLSLLANAAGSTYQGIVQGYAGSVGSAASILGLILGGLLYRNIGVSTFIISAAGTFIIGLIAIRLMAMERKLNT